MKTTNYDKNYNPQTKISAVLLQFTISILFRFSGIFPPVNKSNMYFFKISKFQEGSIQRAERIFKPGFHAVCYIDRHNAAIGTD